MENVPEFYAKKRKVVVTCGPGYEPVDEVRRLTNHSTGRLGTELGRALVRSGFDVICLRGTLSSWTNEVPGMELRPFTTGEHLREELRRLGREEEVGAVFHASALSDFKVKEVCDAAGRPLEGKKISSRLGELQVTLEPAPKVIAVLRDCFPEALLVGWKYELEGTAGDVLQAGLRQIEENGTDACVLNGAAYGKGFGVCEKAGPLRHCEEEEELFAYWISRLEGKKG